MFGPLGFQEVLFILALALLIFGPRELPKIGRTIGGALSEFRKATADFKRTINAEMMEEELRQADPRQAVKEALADVRSLGPGSASGKGDERPSEEPASGDEPPEESQPSVKPATGAVAREAPESNPPDSPPSPRNGGPAES